MDSPPVSYKLPTRSRRHRSTSRSARSVSWNRPIRSTSNSPTKASGADNPRSILKPPEARASFPFRRRASDASDDVAPPLRRPALHTFIQFRPSTPYPGSTVNETRRNTKLNQKNFSAFHQNWVSAFDAPQMSAADGPPAQLGWEAAIRAGQARVPIPVPGTSREAVAAMRNKFNEREGKKKKDEKRRPATDPELSNKEQSTDRPAAGSSIAGSRQVSPIKRGRSDTTGTFSGEEPPVKKARSNSGSSRRKPSPGTKDNSNERNEHSQHNPNHSRRPSDTATRKPTQPQNPHSSSPTPLRVRGRRGKTRLPTHKPSKKRTTSLLQGPDPWTLCPPSEAKAAMPPDIVEQYELAGLDYHEPLPRGNFPHAPFERRDPTQRRKLTLTKAELNTELRSLKPKPLAVQQNSDVDRVMAPATMPRELAAQTLTNMMHRLVGQGEYGRAARAFGLLLRTRLGKKGMDLRAESGWGMGVEILLHQGEPVPPRVEMRQMPDASRYRFRNKKVRGRRRKFKVYYSDSEEEEAYRRKAKESWEKAKRFEKETNMRPKISAEAWAKAKDFFEYLVMQFPASSKTSTGRVSAFDFYHTMYSTWIKHIEELRKAEELKAHQEFGKLQGGVGENDAEDSEPDANENRGNDGNRSNGNHDNQHLEPTPAQTASNEHVQPVHDGYWRPIDPNNEELTEAMAEIVHATYERVKALVEHMDGVVKSLPFSGDHSLVALRAKIERWAAELSVPLPARMRFDFPLQSDDDDWDEDVVWGRNEKRYTREGIEAHSDSDSGSNNSGDEEGTGGGEELSSVPTNVARKLHQVRRMRAAHIKEAKRLMGASVFLRRSAHLRINSWTPAIGLNEASQVNSNEADD